MVIHIRQQASTAHEHDRFVESGFALSFSHSINAVQLKSMSDEESGEDFIAGKRLFVKFA